jgi:hypothetical protein
MFSVDSNQKISLPKVDEADPEVKAEQSFPSASQALI